MARADVIIRGAGIFGLSIAWACVARGAMVEVIDPVGPGAGASGGIVGALAPHVPENWNAKKKFQFCSLLLAAPFWAEIAEIGGLDPLYARAGRVQPVMDAAGLELARARAAGAAELWRGQAVWDVTQAPGAFVPPSPTGWYVRDTLSAHLHPRRACLALASALRERGVHIGQRASAEGRSTVWATGWQGLEELSEAFGKPLGQGIKGQAVLLEYDAVGAAQVFVDGLHIIPHGDGTVAIGSTTERLYDQPYETDAQAEELLSRAVTAMPRLAGAKVVHRWAGLRPRARSRAPVLGPWPGRKGHFVANGGFKIGFGMAPKVAEVMADLVLDARDEIPSDFRLEALL